LILLIHGLSGMAQSFAISRWLIGSLDAIDYRSLAVFVAVVTIAAILVVRRARQWNLLAVEKHGPAHAVARWVTCCASGTSPAPSSRRPRSR